MELLPTMGMPTSQDKETATENFYSRDQENELVTLFVNVLEKLKPTVPSSVLTMSLSKYHI